MSPLCISLSAIDIPSTSAAPEKTVKKPFKREYIPVDADGEVVSDDDPLLEISKEDQNALADDDIEMSEDISFIDDDEITDDDSGINVEINEDDKN